MSIEVHMLRTAEKVTRFVEESVKLAGADKKEEVLALFDTIHQVFPHWAIMTCPVMQPGLNYVSKNCEHIFGHSNEYLTMNSTVSQHFSFVHTDNREGLIKCYDFVHEFLHDIPSEEHSKYRCVFHYRFRKQNGQFIYLHDEKAVITIPDGGNLYYVLFRDVTAERVFNGVKVEIFKQNDTLEKIAEFKPSEVASLTKREGELVTLIKQGLTTKEIAWYLNISHNTVRNIKSKLFEKYNVNNTVELLNLTA